MFYSTCKRSPQTWIANVKSKNVNCNANHYLFAHLLEACAFDDLACTKMHLYVAAHVTIVDKFKPKTIARWVAVYACRFAKKDF